jgi:hypothetical protein
MNHQWEHAAFGVAPGPGTATAPAAPLVPSCLLLLRLPMPTDSYGWARTQLLQPLAGDRGIAGLPSRS